MLFRRSGTLPSDAHRGINAWLIYLAMPAVSFKYLPYVVWGPEQLVPALAPVLVFFAGLFYVKLYASRQSFDQATIGGLMLITALGNTGFIGFPLVNAYFGPQAMSAAVICDQVTVMLFSTVGAAIAVKSSGTKELLLSDILRRVTRFPPLIGCVLALTVPKFIDITPVAPLFDAIAATTAPLAIFSIGLQLQLKGWCEQRGIVCTILAYKLFLAPTAVLVTLLALRIKGTSAEVSVFQMSMPALLSSAVLANQFNLNPGLVNRIVGIGIAVGLCSTGIWYLSTKLLG
jgi:hypothetical protein